MLCFRASGFTRAIKVASYDKFAFEDSPTPKAFVVWDLWMIRTTGVSFLLLDPAVIAGVTEKYSGSRAKREILLGMPSFPRIDVFTVEAEINKAKSAMSKDYFFFASCVSNKDPDPHTFPQ